MMIDAKSCFSVAITTDAVVVIAILLLKLQYLSILQCKYATTRTIAPNYHPQVVVHYSLSILIIAPYSREAYCQAIELFFSTVHQAQIISIMDLSTLVPTSSIIG